MDSYPEQIYPKIKETSIEMKIMLRKLYFYRNKWLHWTNHKKFEMISRKIFKITGLGLSLLTSLLFSNESLDSAQQLEPDSTRYYNTDKNIRGIEVEEKSPFSYFLSNYIDTIYDRRNKFAKDIKITPVSLSQILNNHRKPKEEFLLKLMLHSDLTYRNISKFDKKTWFQVYYHEKIADTMASQDKWLPKVVKAVSTKNSELPEIEL